MAKRVTEKQLAANRRNAQKSTGPKTGRGKGRSSRNALKHGLLAKEVLIQDGDGAEIGSDFDALLADLCDEFQPCGIVEETLVERVATCYWRLRRAQRYEVGAIRESLDECCRRRDDADVETAHDVQVRIDKATCRLGQEQEHLSDLQILPDLADAETRKRVESTLRGLASDLRRDVDGLALGDLHKAVLEAQEELVEQVRAEVQRLRAELKAAKRYDRLRRSRRLLVGSLPVQDTLIKLVRYESMLDRQLHRALTELRRGRLEVKG